MSVTLREVMGAARSRAASLAAEVAGYLVLGAADQAAARAVTGDDVVLGEDGTVRIASGHSADDAQAEAALRPERHGSDPRAASAATNASGSRSIRW